MTDPGDLLSVVARRSDVIRSLLDDPKERHVLVDHVEASKSTVYKAVTQLTERGLVESTPSGLEPTLLGVVALERYERFAQTAELAPLLAELPRESVDPSALVGAEAVVPDSRNVDRHHDRVEALLREGTGVRGFSPAIAPRYVSTISDRLDENTFSLEFVLPGDLVDFLGKERRGALADVVTSPDADLYRTDSTLQFTLLLVDSPDGTEVCVELDDEAGPAGLVLNDTTESRRWAERTLERVRADAEPVRIEGGSPS